MSPSHDQPSTIICQEVLENIADALIFADKEGIIRIWNPAAEAIFGYSASEAMGQSLDLIIPEHLRDAHWRGYHQAIAHGATRHGRRSMITRALHKAGHALYADMSFSIVKNQSGETIGSAAIARDATQRYQEEKQLRRQLAESLQKYAKA